MTTSTPIVSGFEYEVRLAISLPIAWTTLLKQVGAAHYDYKCREAAECGVINGLHNTACDGEFPSNHPVSLRDIHLIMEVLERAPLVDPPAIALAVEIRFFLWTHMKAIEKRSVELRGSGEIP